MDNSEIKRLRAKENYDTDSIKHLISFVQVDISLSILDKAFVDAQEYFNQNYKTQRQSF
jgi:hypothetical protein